MRDEAINRCVDMDAETTRLLLATHRARDDMQANKSKAERQLHPQQQLMESHLFHD